MKKFDKSFIKEIILGHNVSQDVESYAKTLIGSHINILKCGRLKIAILCKRAAIVNLVPYPK
ncbi:hypothetical protein [Klebsiella pneumoniae]|uniref:hypothetical protein n=1 Tax=Klebsiella pneumoniae TaxID=573 RepID=UPI000F53A2AB|nr:hypothetical protein [Klebsiella pneumoniae]